jgi:thiol-disulfide isomerase/thioredoxin
MMQPRSMLPSLVLMSLTLAIAAVAPAQPGALDTPTLTIGSPAPALEVEAWLKGEPVAAFAPGRIYIVEFWATWCGPCIAGMPHLTKLQAQKGDTVTVIGVDIWEQQPDVPYTDQTRARVAQFVADHDADMGYRVAYDGGSHSAAKAWMQAAGLNGIPNAFIVDQAGVIAHIGHPTGPEFGRALDAIIAGTHDLAAARALFEERRVAAARDRAARKAAWERLQAVVAVALPLARAGNHAGAVAACDTLEGVGNAFGPDPRDEARVQVFHALWKAGDQDIAHAYVDHLLEADALGSSRSYGNLAWIMVDPDYGVEGADPARAVLCSTRAIAGIASEPVEMRPLLLDTHAMALATAGRLEEAIAVQVEAVELEDNETMKALMQARLDSYRAR